MFQELFLDILTFEIDELHYLKCWDVITQWHIMETSKTKVVPIHAIEAYGEM